MLRVTFLALIFITKSILHVIIESEFSSTLLQMSYVIVVEGVKLEYDEFL